MSFNKLPTETKKQFLQFEKPPFIAKICAFFCRKNKKIINFGQSLKNHQFWQKKFENHQFLQKKWKVINFRQNLRTYWKIINFGQSLKNHHFLQKLEKNHHFLLKFEKSSIFAKNYHMVTHPSTDEAQCCLTFKNFKKRLKERRRRKKERRKLGFRSRRGLDDLKNFVQLIYLTT